ncbi:DJ-1/PfpI family protein [Patescibacteria group bacterium]|nr:DJ-1/PfpI family protein [Patescibacteria group bacterium]MBU1931454.1 DJ-1/PfpI family protein [Patescibacteria group bacterium]
MPAKKVLMIVAPKNFRDEELFEPKQVLEDAGISVVIASDKVVRATGMLGGEIEVDRDLAEVNLNDYQAVIFVGGSGSSIYFTHPQALALVQKASGLGKVVGAICIAPSILANAGLLKGKRVTAWASEKAKLASQGITYTGEPVTVDGQIITAVGPAAATVFGQAIVEALKK